MPVKRGIDYNGSYFQWGNSGHKYYFISNNKKSRDIAYKKALKQGRAISISKFKRQGSNFEFLRMSGGF